MSCNHIDEKKVAIQVDGISKVYEIYDRPLDRLKKGVLTRVRSYLRLKHKAYFRAHQALGDISFTVHKGETLGIIGHNGAGKSTILQVICGTLTPTSGSVSVTGRISALLELGAGFNPDFTGKENVYMGASIAGLSKHEIDEKYDDILAFAEIGDFIHQPVKTYSSGMYVRLAFAVSIILTPDILIVDEALSVGDAYFQKKCKDKLAEFTAAGGTLLLVTHSTESLIQMCDRGVVLDKGQLIFDGATKDAVAAYMRKIFGSHTTDTVDVTSVTDVGSRTDITLNFKKNSNECYDKHPSYNKNEIRLGDGRAIVADVVSISNKKDSPIILYSGDTLELYVKYLFKERLNNVIMGAVLSKDTGLTLYSSNTFVETGELFSFDKDELLINKLSLKLPLMPGQYFMTLGVSKYNDDCSEIEALDRRANSLIITILPREAHGDGIVNMNATFEVGI